MSPVKHHSYEDLSLMGLVDRKMLAFADTEPLFFFLEGCLHCGGQQSEPESISGIKETTEKGEFLLCLEQSEKIGISCLNQGQIL